MLEVKMSPKKVLSMRIVEFDIRPIELWIDRLVGTDLRLRTIADLAGAYPYVFETGLIPGKLGPKPIEQLKVKLLSYGLTANEWPALVPRTEFLDVLSKERILEIPVAEVFAERNHLNHSRIALYFECSREEVANKTLKDILQINPMTLMNRPGQYMGSSKNFFDTYKEKFIRIHQELTKKGFTISDGEFFNWNPETGAYKKATDILERYGLNASQIQKFAQIVIAERWVI